MHADGGLIMTRPCGGLTVWISLGECFLLCHRFLSVLWRVISIRNSLLDTISDMAYTTSVRSFQHSICIEQLRWTAGKRQVTVKAETAICAYAPAGSLAYLCLV